VWVQARRTATPKDTYAQIGMHKTESDECVIAELTVISDMATFTDHIIDAPYVGYSMSTPQLYLTTNIGYQCFKNSLENPNRLDSFQVAAVLQNTFAVGQYLSGGGDLPVTMNDCDLTNLEFVLRDANFHPVRLYSPMFVFLKVEPVADPTRDTSQFRIRDQSADHYFHGVRHTIPDIRSVPQIYNEEQQVVLAVTMAESQGIL
jgi:hypothetical protein